MLRAVLNARVLTLTAIGTVAIGLAAIQYRWINEVSNAAETRAAATLQSQVTLVSDAFDTEITRAALAFEVPPASESEAFNEVDHAWREWKGNARWAGMVSGLALVQRTDGKWRTRWLGNSGAIDPTSLDLSTGPESGMTQSFTNREFLLLDEPALLRPVASFSERTPGSLHMSWLIVRFDRRYLEETLFPALVRQYSGIAEQREFQFQLDGGPGTSGRSTNVAVAGLFHFRPDCLTPRLESSGWGAAGMVGITSNTHVGRESLLQTLLNAEGRCTPMRDASRPGLLRLAVYNRESSQKDFYSQFRRRNLLLSGLALAVLLTTLGALIVSVERARSLADMQSVIAAGISHELRTPLASLNLAADDLKAGHVKHELDARRYGELIDKESRRLGHIVDQALALSALNQAKGPQQYQSVSLLDILHAALDSFAPRLRNAGIQVEVSAAAGASRIQAEPEPTLRCVTNLLENSIRYAGSGKLILISIHAVRRFGRAMVELSFEDRGPGIREDERKAVFEPFYRGAAARESRKSGSGLGLAIVKRAVEASGGWVELENAIPQGCRLRLFFRSTERTEDAR